MATAEQTREALIGALIKLLEERSLGEISVREIAAEAGVNHGLVHRYYGSKDNLVHAAARRVSEEIHRGYPGQRGMSAFTFRYLRDHPEVVRIVARACLESRTDLLRAASPDPARLEQIIAPLCEAMARTGIDTGVDPHVPNAFAISALFGWFLFHPLLEEGFGLPFDADEQVEGLLQLLDFALAGD